MKPESRENPQDYVRTEKEISENEAQYQVLFEKAPVSIALLNSAGIITDCNQACERLLGYRKEEIIGKPFQKLMVLDPHDLPDLVTKFEKFFRGEYVAPYELEVTKKTGERCWITIINSLMMKGDKIVGLQVLATDITEKKQAEKLLSESEKKFRDKSLELQVVNEIISYGNIADNLTTFLQKTLTKILQLRHFLGGGIYLYNEANKSNILATYESLPQDFIELVQEVDMTQEPYSKIIEKQEPIIFNDFAHIIPEAEQWKIQSVITIPILAKNRYIGNLNIAAEANIPADFPVLKILTLIGREIGVIIEKFQTEQLLIESEERYRTLFEESPFLIMLINLKGKIIDVNSAVEKLFGFQKNSIIDTNFLEFKIFSPEIMRTLKQHFEKRISGDLVDSVELPITNSNGAPAWILSKMSRIKIENETIFLYIIQDITERKTAQQKLKESEEKYRSLFEGSPFVITLVNSKGKVIDINSTVEKVFGYKKNDLIGRNFLDLGMYSPEALQILKQNFQKRLKGELVDYIEVPIIKSNGDTAWIYPKMSLLKLENETIFLYIIQDITERKIAQQKLKESEEKYRHIIENVQDTVVIIDFSGKFLFISPQISSVLGRKITEPGLDAITQLIHKDDIKGLLDSFKQAVQKKDIRNQEYREFRALHQDGHYIWIGASIKGHSDANGQFNGFIATLRDITARKKMELEHKESEEKYRALFEQSPHSIVLNDSKGTVIDVNSTVVKLFGYTKKDMLGKNFLDLGIFSPEAILMVKQNFLKRLKGAPIEYYEIPVTKSNGEIVWIFPQGTQIKVGNEPHILYILQDITERKMAQQKLKESEEKYRLITENLNDLILVYSSENNIEYINEETHQRLLGYTKEDLQGTKPLDLIHPEDRDSLVKSFRTVFDNKEISEEVRVKRKDGTYLWVQVKAKTFKDGSGQNKFLNISRDISERRVLEETRKSNMKYLEHEVEQKTQELRKETEELQKTLESLKIAQEYLVQSEKLASIGLLAAGIAHEINNPLMGIINYAQIIRDELETQVKLDLSIKPYSFLDGIIKEGERISEIVEGLLRFAREDKGQFINADISEIINSALALLLPKIKNSQIEIKLEYDSSLPKVPMKTRNIRQVILNVIQNSITALNEKYGSFSRKGDKIITIKTSGLILDDKPYAKISIKDNGTGIRSEDLPKVFDPFYTTKGAKGTKGEGMGLGLSISYGIIKDHRGRIEIQSEWGSWTLLVITLPLEL